MLNRPPGARPIGGSFLAITRSVVATVRAFRTHRLVWAIPIMFVLFVVAGVLAGLALVPAIAPFVYPLL